MESSLVKYAPPSLSALTRFVFMEMERAIDSWHHLNRDSIAARPESFISSYLDDAVIHIAT